MNRDVQIRPVKAEDAEQYINLTNYVWRNAYKHIFPEDVFIERERNSLERIASFPNNIKNGGDYFVYVAEDNGKVVGFVSARLGTNYEHFVKEGMAEIMAMYILPEYQGFGLGSKFKNMFIDWATGKGAKEFVIGVLKDNFKARKVYEKWGGKLDNYTQSFEMLGTKYDEVFYTYNII